MNDVTQFVKGEQYTNRKGTYTVLDVKPTSITVRYEDGLEETLDVKIQSRILSNMTLPPRTPEPPPRARGGRVAAKPKAPAAPAEPKAAPAPRVRRSRAAAKKAVAPAAEQ